MALFGGMRDAKFLASINRELLNAIIDTEIEFFKLHVESSNSNIYGESTSKSYYDVLNELRLYFYTFDYIFYIQSYTDTPCLYT